MVFELLTHLNMFTYSANMFYPGENCNVLICTPFKAEFPKWSNSLELACSKDLPVR